MFGEQRVSELRAVRAPSRRERDGTMAGDLLHARSVKIHHVNFLFPGAVARHRDLGLEDSRKTSEGLNNIVCKRVSDRAWIRGSPDITFCEDFLCAERIVEVTFKNDVFAFHHRLRFHQKFRANTCPIGNFKGVRRNACGLLFDERGRRQESKQIHESQIVCNGFLNCLGQSTSMSLRPPEDSGKQSPFSWSLPDPTGNVDLSASANWQLTE